MTDAGSTRIFDSGAVAYDQHLVPACSQFLGHCDARKQVSAGPAAGYDDIEFSGQR